MKPDSPSLLFKIIFQKYPPVPQAWKAQRAEEDTVSQNAVTPPLFPPAVAWPCSDCPYNIQMFLSLTEERKKKKGTSSIGRQEGCLQRFQQEKVKIDFMAFLLFCFSVLFYGLSSRPQKVSCGSPALRTLLIHIFPSPGGFWSLPVKCLKELAA